MLLAVKGLNGENYYQVLFVGQTQEQANILTEVAMLNLPGRRFGGSGLHSFKRK